MSRAARRAWTVLAVALGLTLAADPLVHHDPHFGIDGTFGFNAWFGFLSCLACVGLAKGLGALLQRPDDHYRD